MSEKSEKIIILGKAGSGKSHLFSKLSEKGLKTCVKWTTRPIRKFEKQGIHYNFVNESDFIESINENNFLTYQSFEVTPEDSDPQTWYYGTTLQEFNEAQVFIMTPGEFNEFEKIQDLRKGCFVVYLDIARATREKRLYKREDKNDSVKRRLDSDEIDFKDDFDYDLRITDPDFGVDDVYSLMN